MWAHIHMPSQHFYTRAEKHDPIISIVHYSAILDGWESVAVFSKICYGLH